MDPDDDNSRDSRDEYIQKIGLWVSALRKTQVRSKQPHGPPIHKEAPDVDLVAQAVGSPSNTLESSAGQSQQPCDK